MLFSICGDLHAQSNNKDSINKVFDQLEYMGNDVILLGDVLHNKRIVQSDAFNLVYKRLKESKYKFTILVGNHDYHNDDCREHALEALKDLPNVVVVDEPVIMRAHKTVIGLIPYCGDLAKFRATIEPMKEEVHVLFIHQGVNQFDFGNGIVENNGINIDELADFPLVISGHFHMFQADKNLVYLGTPFSHSHGESNQDKFLAEFNAITLDLTYLPTNLPKHITLELTLAELTAQKDEIVLKAVTNNVRILLQGTAEELQSFDRAEYTNIRFIERVIEDNSGVTLSETDSNEQKFSAWAEMKAIDQPTIDLGLELLRRDNRS